MNEKLSIIIVVKDDTLLIDEVLKLYKSHVTIIVYENDELFFRIKEQLDDSLRVFYLKKEQRLKDLQLRKAMFLYNAVSVSFNLFKEIHQFCEQKNTLLIQSLKLKEGSLLTLINPKSRMFKTLLEAEKFSNTYLLSFLEGNTAFWGQKIKLIPRENDNQNKQYFNIAILLALFNKLEKKEEVQLFPNFYVAYLNEFVIGNKR